MRTLICAAMEKDVHEISSEKNPSSTQKVAGACLGLASATAVAEKSAGQESIQTRIFLGKIVLTGQLREF